MKFPEKQILKLPKILIKFLLLEYLLAGLGLFVGCPFFGIPPFVAISLITLILLGLISLVTVSLAPLFRLHSRDSKISQISYFVFIINVLYFVLAIFAIILTFAGFYENSDLAWNTSCPSSNKSCPSSASLGIRDEIYFSTVTWTTTGYGDIIPTTAHCRIVAMIEMFCGTAFTALLTASLVSQLGVLAIPSSQNSTSDRRPQRDNP